MSERNLIYACGQVELDLVRRELLVQGTPAAIGDRALEVLAVLVQSAGELVTKDELMRRIWPGAIVEENTLEVHVSALRKALGRDRGLLKTTYARGYRVLGAWTSAMREGSQPAGNGLVQPLTRPGRTNLPISSSVLIGRVAAVQYVCDLLSAHRVVTLTGTGGIGKTRLALEVAHQWLQAVQGDVWLVEMASLLDPSLVPSAVARAIGLKMSGGDYSADAVARSIEDARTLIILDNCEHVVDAAATLADAIMRLCPRSTVLVTSREALRISGEQVYRVPALDVPTGAIGPGDVLAYGAAKLFVAQARAQDAEFSPKEDEVSAIAAICRRLDGIPLALEFAAARAATIGVVQVAAGLSDRFELLTVGRRTALPRHRTLRATLDWSYDLLLENEAATLRRLAVFVGDFTLAAAKDLLIDLPRPQEAVDSITNLVAKSLMLADLRDGTPHYRLFETVRMYALEKLRSKGEHQAAARHHAEYYRRISAQAERESETRAEPDWITAYGRHLDNWRAALDWAFSPDGDPEIGLALTVGALPIWFKLSLMNECRKRVEQALAIASAEADPAATMRLSAARAAALFYTEKGAVPEIAAAWTNVLTIAERLDDIEHRLWAGWGLWNYQLNQGEFGKALASAQRFAALATDSADLASGDRMVGVSLHYLGEQAQARQRLENALVRRSGAALRSMTRIQYDQKLAARSYLPRVLWLQGFPDQAMRAAEAVVRDARESGHLLALSLALVQAGCPVALLAGDTAAAEGFIETLVGHTTTHSLGFWRAESRCYEGILRVGQGDVLAGLQVFRAALQDLNDYNTNMNVTGYLAGMAAALSKTDEVTQGAAMVRVALDRAERDDDRWCMSELLRLRGTYLLLEDGPDAAVLAEAQFREALGWAARQEALSWALRAGTSLACLMRHQKRALDARSLLAPIYAQFNEGFGTVDLVRARRILEAVD